ncbi:hypothetical protein ABQE93_09130 [Mycolicibacterium sp. XJ662]
MKTLGRPASRLLAVCLAAWCIPVLVHPPAAWADDLVTYEVVSDSVSIADVEYQTSTGRITANSVALPWRVDAPVRTFDGPPPNGSQVRADWRPVAAPRRWVSVRVIHHGKVICQSTLDVGNATCYGNVPRIS